MWAAAFRGREEEGEGGKGADELLLNPLVGMFVVFGPVYPRVWFARFSGRKSFPRGDAFFLKNKFPLTLFNILIKNTRCIYF